MHISKGDCSKQAKCASLLLVLAQKKKKNAKEITPDSHGTTTVLFLNYLHNIVGDKKIKTTFLGEGSL